jgi:hypothetical protein
MNTINEPQQKASESLSSNDKIFDFPLLVDSSIKGGLITYNQDMKNTKEKISECDLELCDENGNKKKTNFFIDYETLFNLNYEMKSFINQVNETIKNFNK